MRFSQILAKFAVSLFTREWIEIVSERLLYCPVWSPSLRGSGLKLGFYYAGTVKRRLPLYEGVD